MAQSYHNTNDALSGSDSGNLVSTIGVLEMLVFVVPLTQFIEVKWIGNLFGPDFLLLVLFPFLVARRGHLLMQGLPRILIILCAVWLIGQVVTDVVRQSDFRDYSRGWAKIALTGVNFSALYLLINGRSRRILLFATGLAVGGILQFYISPIIYAESYPWKFGVGMPITALLIVMACLVDTSVGARRAWPVAFVLIGALLNLYFGYRSLAGICFLTGTFLIARRILWQQNAHGVMSAIMGLGLVGLLGVAAAMGFLKTYEYAAENGLLGDATKQVHEAQAAGEYGLLLGGRSEILVSSQAIMESPIIGHGSWAKDESYAKLLVESKLALGYSRSEEDEEGLIPTHSHILGAWVETGILGAVFWIWVLSLPVRVFANLPHVAMRLAPLIIFVALLLFWDVLFSPYGAERRYITPYYIIVLISVLSFQQLIPKGSLDLRSRVP